MLKKMVLNPEDIHLTPPPDTLGRDPQYDHVIITSSSLGANFEPLVQWHNKKGVSDTVVTTSWIYSNFSGSNNAARIRNFVSWASATWGTLWFLLGGDTAVIPYGTSYYVGNTIPHDTYYSDYDDDWICEVFVGRAPVTSTGEVDTFVNKVLNYEKNPPGGSFPRKIGLFGFDLDAESPGEEYMEFIGSNYVPAGWTQVKVYDSYAGNHRDDALAAMNAGLNLIAHIDHCNYNVMGMGYTHHGWTIGNTDMDNLTNGNMVSLINSTGCWPNAIDYDSIAEHFVKNPNGGGYGFIGNTRYGWYNPGPGMHTLSEKLMEDFFKSLFVLGFQRVGQALADSKNRNNPSTDQYRRYCWVENILLGEPELPIWTSSPKEVTVVHLTTIYPITQDFPVSVFHNGLPLEGALVGLLKENEVQASGTTNEYGQVNLSISPVTTGTLYVTVTGANASPYEGTCSVVTGSGSPPTITGVNPDHGPATGGILVTITGSNFTSDTFVWFGNRPSFDVTVNSSSELVALLPMSPYIEVVDVKVLTRNGQYTLPGGFTYDLVPPLVQSVSPDRGPAEGGTFVTITGCYFESTSTLTVAFGSNEAPGVTVIDNFTLTCFTPYSEEGGPVDVSVTNDAGTGTFHGGFIFQFPPPVITSISPTVGPPEGGTEVTIYGNYFCTYMELVFIQIEDWVNPLSLTYIDSHTLLCVTPPMQEGPATLLLVNPEGLFCFLDKGYTYAAPYEPVLTQVVPDYGHIAGGNQVTIYGNYFTRADDMQVLFGGIPATNLNLIDSTTLGAKVPAGSSTGNVDVEVTTCYGSDTLTDGYEYLDRPILYFLGGDPIPGGSVAFKVVAPDRPGEGVILVANDKLGSKYFPPPWDLYLDMSLTGIRILFNSISRPGPKLNASGQLTLLIKYPSFSGPTVRFQAIAGTISPPNVDSSNYLDF